MKVFWGKQACSAYYAKIFLGQHMFLIFLFEMMHCLCFTPSHSFSCFHEQRGHNLVHQIFDVLPSLSCWSPHDSLNIMRNPTAVKGN